jgi:hypothetical protein
VLQILEARAAHGEGRGGFRVFRSPRRTNPPGVSLYLFTVNARLVIGDGPVAELVGIEGGVVSGVFNLESSDVGASDRRPRHEENYHEV